MVRADNYNHPSLVPVSGLGTRLQAPTRSHFLKANLRLLFPRASRNLPLTVCSKMRRSSAVQASLDTAGRDRPSVGAVSSWTFHSQSSAHCRSKSAQEGRQGFTQATTTGDDYTTSTKQATAITQRDTVACHLLSPYTIVISVYFVDLRGARKRPCLDYGTPERKMHPLLSSALGLPQRPTMHGHPRSLCQSCHFHFPRKWFS